MRSAVLLTATPVAALRLGGAAGPPRALTGAAPGAPAAVAATETSASVLTVAAELLVVVVDDVAAAGPEATAVGAAPADAALADVVV